CRRRRHDRFQTARAVPDGRTQPPLVDDCTAALVGRSRRLRRLGARLGVLPGAGDPASAPRELRQGRRLLHRRALLLPTPPPPARRADPTRLWPRRRAYVGVLLQRSEE